MKPLENSYALKTRVARRKAAQTLRGAGGKGFSSSQNTIRRLLVRPMRTS